MPVLFQSWIIREDLRANDSVLYVFGDNVRRTGYGGQAKEMRGEPNAVGVATKYMPHMSEAAFFEDDDEAVKAQKRIIDEDMSPLFEHIKKGGIAIWPRGGIGTERAELATRSPQTFQYIQDKLASLIRAGKLF